MNIGKHMFNALLFALRHDNGKPEQWNTFAQDRKTKRAIASLARLRFVEISKSTKQFALINSPVRFFYANAGFGYDPKIETEEQGRLRCALALAKAERFANKVELDFETQDDTCIGGDCGETETCEHPCCQGTEHECIVMLCKNSKGEIIASLGSICEPSNEYLRVVSAELALEAMEGKRA